MAPRHTKCNASPNNLYMESRELYLSDSNAISNTQKKNFSRYISLKKKAT